jgi:uncharacterized protein with HEPN domain
MSNKRAAEIFLFDIYVAISKIQIVCDKFDDADDLLHDFVSWDSVIREFEIIGEATKVCIRNGLIDDVYKIVVDFRNKITHHYFGIDNEAVWNIVYTNLSDYKVYILKKIQTMEDMDLKYELLKATKVDNRNYKQVTEQLENI